PYSVICFDEIEKAHPDAFNMLLQIMEDGHLSDAKGRRVDFRNTIIIMTSNVGGDVITRDTTLGFRTAPSQEEERDAYKEMKSKLTRELKRLFRPEFLNRVDEVVVFHALTREDVEKIVDIQLERVNERLSEHGIRLTCTRAAHDLLMQEGFDPQFGARPMRRAIQRLVEDPLAEKMLMTDIPAGTVITVDAEE
ncbi:MAG: ATP-dependent Clp protease ATP-binding subunit, partial [Chloroflexi bacterium]|nr:ATP-dependent Clp protease ATP-binding subunit [Chloroflexota bacterium]